jgi:hypothetical protein
MAVVKELAQFFRHKLAFKVPEVRPATHGTGWSACTAENACRGSTDRAF